MDTNILYHKILDTLTSNSSWYDDEFGDLFEDFAKQCARVVSRLYDVDPATVDVKFVKDYIDTIKTEIEVGPARVDLVWEYEDPRYGVIVD